VHRDHPRGAELDEREQRLGRVDVRALHEVAGLDRRDGQEREIEVRKHGARGAEFLGRVGGVAPEIDGFSAVFDDVPRERGHPVDVGAVAPAHVLHRHGRDAQAVDLDRRPRRQLTNGK
jgi:hypothetical protein